MRSRSAPMTSVTVTGNESVLTSTVAWPAATRLRYHSGWVGAPPLEPKMYSAPSPFWPGWYTSGVTYSFPLVRPTWCTRIMDAPSNMPPTRPSLARNSSMMPWFQSFASGMPFLSVRSLMANYAPTQTGLAVDEFRCRSADLVVFRKRAPAAGTGQPAGVGQDSPSGFRDFGCEGRGARDACQVAHCRQRDRKVFSRAERLGQCREHWRGCGGVAGDAPECLGGVSAGPVVPFLEQFAEAPFQRCGERSEVRQVPQQGAPAGLSAERAGQQRRGRRRVARYPPQRPGRQVRSRRGMPLQVPARRAGCGTDRPECLRGGG